MIEERQNQRGLRAQEAAKERANRKEPVHLLPVYRGITGRQFFNGAGLSLCGGLIRGRTTCGLASLAAAPVPMEISASLV